MKKLGIIIISLIINVIALGQNESIIKYLNETPYIFKGRVIHINAFKGKDSIIYASYIVDITKIYKGKKLKLGTIEILAKAPEEWEILDTGLWLSGKVYSNIFNPGSGVKGIFFCKKTQIESNYKKTVNKLRVTPVCLNQECFFKENEKYNYNLDKSYSYITGFKKKYKNWEELEHFFAQNGIRVIKPVKKKDALSLDSLTQKQKNNEIYQQRLKNYNKYLQFLKKRISKNKGIKHNKSNEEITFEVTNEEITGNNPKYYEFDIKTYGNTNDTYLDNAAFCIKYNTLPFGSNIVANNKITVTLGANFLTPTYDDPMNGIIDDTTFAVRFRVGFNYNTDSWNRTLLTTNHQQLAHVKIEISNCIDYTNIEFIDIQNVSVADSYTLTATEDPMNSLLTYDYTDYMQPLDFQLCPPPIIENFYPTSISAGTNSVLTIEGHNFGNDKGYLIFPANEGNVNTDSLVKYFDYIDYTWSDTLIKFTVPSHIDTLNINYGVGSGYFKIKRYEDGSIAESPSPLNVTFSNITVSIARFTENYQKIPLRVISDDSDTTKYFYLDSSITNHPLMEEAIRNVLHKWSCATLINWTIADTIVHMHDNSDYYSVIFLEDSYHGTPLARFIPHKAVTCRDDNGNIVFAYKDYDIAISRDFNNINSTQWFIDTSYVYDLPDKEQDFCSVFAHELGHVHGLDHVNDTTDIMNTHAKMGSIDYYNRVDLYSSPNAINGGVYILNKSVLMDNCGDLSVAVPSTAYNCEANIKVNELFNNNLKILTYPNPFKNYFNIEFELERNADIKVLLYNYMGVKIFEDNYKKMLIGKHYVKINTENINAGLYVLIIQVNKKLYKTKVIKM